MHRGYSGLGGTGAHSGYGSMGSLLGHSTLGRNYRGPQAENDPQNQKNQQQDPQRNSRKVFFEEWFKMMGGLQAIVQLGMAAIGIASLYTQLSAMTKKLIEVIKNMAGGIVNFMRRRVGAKLAGRFADPKTRMKTIKAAVFNCCRIFALLLMCLAAKMKTEIRRDNDQRLRRLEEQYQNTKKESLELEEAGEEEQMLREQDQEEPQQFMQNATL